MNVVVQRAVRGAHQMDQIGLAEGNCVLFCNANKQNTQNKTNVKNDGISLKNVQVCILPKLVYKNHMRLHAAPALTCSPPNKLTYL